MGKRSSDHRSGADLRVGMERINHLQFPSDNGIAVGQGFPVDGMSIDESAEPGTCVLNKMTAFPRLKAEVDRGESKVGSDWNLVAGIGANADGDVREEQRMALGSAEFCHGSGDY